MNAWHPAIMKEPTQFRPELPVEKCPRYKHEAQASEFSPANWRSWNLLTRLRFVLVFQRPANRNERTNETNGKSLRFLFTDCSDRLGSVRCASRTAENWP